MSNTEDVSIYPDERLGWSSDYAIANGKAGGTTVPNGGAADTQLVFLYRGFYGTVNTDRTGARYPIDSSVYKKLSFKMRSDVAVGSAGRPPRSSVAHQRHHHLAGLQFVHDRPGRPQPRDDRRHCGLW